MFTAILQFLVSAATIYLAGKYISKIHVRSFGTAMLVALAVGILNFLVGWLLVLLLNIATLGLFWITGLSFIISIVVNAVIIELVDQLSKGFNTEGFWPSLWLAILMALVNAIVFAII